MKTCTRCKTSKPLSDFSPNRSLKSKDGLSYQCKACKCEMAAAWRIRNRERRREYDAFRYYILKQT